MSASATIGRVALMVLSGTATLSLIGAIVETADTGPGGTPPAPTTPIGRVATEQGEWVAVPETVRPSVEPAPPPAARDTERWLRAISYSLTALAGFAAAGLVVLLRIASALSRIADRGD